MNDFVEVKLIHPEQVQALALSNATETLANDPSYKDNKVLAIPYALYTQFVDFMRELLTIIEDKGQRTWIDRELYKFFLNFKINPNVGGSIEFWNSITIQTDEAIEVVKKRWAHDKNWFREENSLEEYDHNEVRRYAVANNGDLYRLTFTRIWLVAAKFDPKFMDTVLLQQDFIEYVVGVSYTQWDRYDHENYKMRSRVLDIIIEEIASWDTKIGKGKYKKLNRQWLSRRVFSYLTLLNEGSIIEDIKTSELRIIIAEFFEFAVKEQLAA